jgi:hypothetical protein
MQYIKLRKVCNTKFVVQNSVCITTFQTVLRVSALFPANTNYTGRFLTFSVCTNICNKKTKRPALMELFTATGKLKKVFLTTRDVRCVHRG